jgi:hypothetical protein
VQEFVSWYYKVEDLSTVQNVLSAARAIDNYYGTQRILVHLQVEMQKFQQKHFWRAIIKHAISYDSFVSVEPEYKAPWEQLRAKAPTCLRASCCGPKKTKIG